MAESDVKIRASHNEMLKEFNESPSKYYYVKYFNGEKNYKGDDDEQIVFDAHLRHNEIGNRSIERSNPYTFKSLEETIEKYVKEYEKENKYDYIRKINCSNNKIKYQKGISNSEHKGIIDLDTWNKVQEILQSNNEFKNKNYLYEPVVDNKYYTSETKYFDIVKKADNGYKVKDKQNNNYYILTYGWQGYYYKDYDAFKDNNEVCYIPEYVNKEENSSCVLVPLDKKNNSIYYRDDILNAVRNEINGKVYENFFSEKAPEKLIEQIAEYVLDVVDWQHPESYIYETEWDDTIKEYFSKNEDDKNKYASSELIKELNSGEFEYE